MSIDATPAEKLTDAITAFGISEFKIALFKFKIKDQGEDVSEKIALCLHIVCAYIPTYIQPYIYTYRYAMLRIQEPLSLICTGAGASWKTTDFSYPF